MPCHLALNLASLGHFLAEIIEKNCPKKCNEPHQKIKILISPCEKLRKVRKSVVVKVTIFMLREQVN